MIVINTPIPIEQVEARFDEAQALYDKLVGCGMSEEEIKNISETMTQTDESLSIAVGAINEEMELNEFMVKRVNSKGEMTKVKDRKTRSLRAYQTTGLSKARRREIARKVVKAKKANPAGVVRGNRKRKKAMAKRKAFGLANNGG